MYHLCKNDVNQMYYFTRWCTFDALTYFCLFPSEVKFVLVKIHY